MTSVSSMPVMQGGGAAKQNLRALPAELSGAIAFFCLEGAP
jgi:hypothetical protein